MIKKILLIISIAIVSLNANSQVKYGSSITYTAFDTNGPMGECLFNQNENGEIIYSDVVHCNMSSDSIKGLLEEWFYDLEHTYQCSVNDLLWGLTKICFEIEIPVGVESFNTWSSVASFIRHKSQVTFKCVIDIRNGKYRYTLSDFYTNRRSIKGEAKSEGPSNMIHWQRMNSLKKERAQLLSQNKVDNEKVTEYNSLIEDEKVSYQAEYNAVMYVLNVLKEHKFTIISDF